MESAGLQRHQAVAWCRDTLGQFAITYRDGVVLRTIIYWVKVLRDTPLGRNIRSALSGSVLAGRAVAEFHEVSVKAALRPEPRRMSDFARTVGRGQEQALRL